MSDYKGKPASYWKEKLTAEQYRICREKGTEPAFSGAYHDSKTSGTYLCVCCDAPLFDADHKFNSGTGWPSFFETVDANNVAKKEDKSLWMRRTEVLCSQCDAHLGHLFNDGPAPTGLRYCINSAALKLLPKK